MNKQRLIIISGILILLIIGVIAIFIVKTNQTPKTAIYTDPLTGEKVVDNSQQTQAPSDSRFPNKPTYLGFSKLMTYGLSNSQLDSVQMSLYNYSQDQPTKFREISLDLSSIRQPDSSPSSPAMAFEFNIKVNRTDDYFVRVEYTNTTSCVTKLYKSDKTTLLYTQ
jgi:hypothetical protein